MVAATLPKGFLLVVIAAFLVPFSAAYVITGFAVTANGAPVSAISPSHEQLVDISFTSDLNSGYAMLDLSGLHADPRIAANYQKTRVTLTGCAYNATANASHCVLPGLVIMPPNATVAIPYYLFSNGQESPGTLTAQFTLDNTSPSVTSVVTSICDASNTRCYIGSGIPMNVTVTLDDSDGTFSKHLIFYQLGPTLFNAQNCTGNTCAGTATVACSDEQPLDLKVVAANGVPSQDDAGNPVSNPGQVTRVVCDAAAPQIVNVSVNGTGLLGLITEDGELLVHASVQDAVTLVTMSAKTGQVQRNVSANTTMSAQCTRTVNDLQECELAIGNLQAGRNLNLPLTFTDQVGHTTSKTLSSIIVLKVANASAQPSFFSAKAYAVTPGTINRAALQLAFDNAIDYPLFVNYRITQLSSGAKILKQEMKATDCQVVAAPKQQYSDAFSPHLQENWTATPALFLDPIKVFDPGADWSEANRLDMSFLKMDTQQLASDLILVRCNLTLTVEKDDVLYPLPEQETLYWPLKLQDSKLGSPGAAFITKLHAAESDANGGTDRLIGYANTLTSTFAHLCEMQGVINKLASGSIGIETVGSLLMMTGAGQGLAQSGNQLYNRAMLMSLTYWTGKLPDTGLGKAASDLKAGVTGAASDQEGKARTFCNYIHCDIANATAAKKNSLVSAGDDFLNFSADAKSNAMYGSYLEDLNTPDVSNSLIMSAATGCVGGVVYNLNKYRQIDCGYVECLKEQALDGASVTPCEEAKGVKLCRFVTGEVFELPYIRVIKNLAANVNQVVQAPLGLLFNQLNAQACAGQDTQIGPAGIACHLMKSLAIQKDFQSVTKYNGLFSFPYQADLCQQALCTGNACGRTTNSLIEQLAPGMGYMGDAYRVTWQQQRDQQARAQQNTELFKEFDTFLRAPAPLAGDSSAKPTSIKSADYPALVQYSKTYDIKDPDFFNAIKKQQCSGDNVNSCEVVFNKMITQNTPPKNVTAFTSSYQRQPNNDPAYAAFTNIGNPSLTNNICAKLDDQGNCIPKACLNTMGTDWKDSPDSDPTCKTDHTTIESYEATISKSGQVLCNYGDTLYICDESVWGSYGATTTTTNDGKATPIDSCPVSNTAPAGCMDEKAVAATQTGVEAAKAHAQSVANFYGWVDQMGSLIFQYAREQGQLTFLFTSGWGDWGASVSKTSNEYLTVQGWQDNLCNPAGTFSDFTQDDGAVYAWSAAGAYRAVLTFAAEKLPIGARADGTAGQYLYTLSVVAVSPDYDNSMNIILNPGGKVVQDQIALGQGSVVNWAKAVNDTKEYTDVCIQFRQAFPQPGAQTSYCRKLQLNAYDRGSVTNETLPEMGTANPWAGPSYAAQGAAAATSTGAGTVGGAR